jgi:hypothetical protein
MAAAGVATLLNKINEKHTIVAVDGTLYKKHPHFRHLMTQKIKQLIRPGLTVSTTPWSYFKECFDITYAKFIFYLQNLIFKEWFCNVKTNYILKQASRNRYFIVNIFFFIILNT